MNEQLSGVLGNKFEKAVQTRPPCDAGPRPSGCSTTQPPGQCLNLLCLERLLLLHTRASLLCLQRAVLYSFAPGTEWPRVSYALFRWRWPWRRPRPVRACGPPGMQGACVWFEAEECDLVLPRTGSRLTLRVAWSPPALWWRPCPTSGPHRGWGVVFLLPVSLPSVGLSSDEGYPVLSRFVIRPRSW